MGSGCTKQRSERYELLTNHPLVQAAQDDDEPVVRKLVAADRKEEFHDPISRALFEAIDGDRVDMVRLLLQGGYVWKPVGITRLDANKNPFVTLKGNHPAGPEHLAEVSVATNYLGPFGEHLGDDGTCPERAPLDDVDPPRMTNGPLQHAVRVGSVEAVEALADSSRLLAEPRTIALVAQRAYDPKNAEAEAIQCARILLRATEEHWPWPGSVSMVHHALHHDREQLARFFLAIGDDVDQKNEAGLTPLQEHAGCGNAKAVRFLLEVKADVHAEAEDAPPLCRYGQMMAIHFAAKSAMSGQREILLDLIAASGDVNAQAWEKLVPTGQEEDKRQREKHGSWGYSTYSKVVHVKSEAPHSVRRIVRPSYYYPALWLLWEEHKKLCGA